MATYLYGLILPRNAALLAPGITGIGGEPLRVVPCATLAALVGTIGAPPERANLDAIRAHDAALRALVSHGVTVAASRFGQSLDDDEAVRAHVDERAARVTALLEDADGCVEMRVAFVAPRAERGTSRAAARAGSTGAGTAYLQRLRQRQPDLARLSRREALGALVRDERIDVLPRPDAVVLAHLVRREDEPAYRAAIGRMRDLAGAQVVGPLPLYTFAEPPGR